MRVAHLTSAHPRNDSRIFLKQCRSLASSGYDVSFVVADGLGDELIDGVSIIDAGQPSGRVDRIARATRRVQRKARELNADIYHLHDPELLPAGLKLKRQGKRVIFDAHEDVAKQMLSKPYLGPLRLRALAATYRRFECYACSRLNGVIAATPAVGERFRSINERTAVVNNFPLLDELATNASWNGEKHKVCYVGAISVARGIREIIEAMSKVKSSARLLLAGAFSESAVETEVRSMAGWGKTDALGFIDRDHLRRVLGESVAGLVTLHPTPNHMDSHPIKMFEYMSAGIPVIASDFPLWRKIIETADCGYCVDALDSGAIAESIDELMTDQEEAKRLGENGRKAVMERYNWPTEEKKLLAFYASLVDEPSL